MRKFKLLIHGKNFLVSLDQGPQKHGFYATRFVEAENEDLAIEAAMNLLRIEYKDIVLNSKADSPVMFVDEIHEVDSFKASKSLNRGAAWYVVKSLVSCKKA